MDLPNNYTPSERREEKRGLVSIKVRFPKQRSEIIPSNLTDQLYAVNREYSVTT